MGFPVEFNWALKLKKDQGLNEEGLREGGVYKFFKGGHRIYPVNMPLDLINGNWEVVAKVIITGFALEPDSTRGNYKVLKVYSKEERKFLTKYWRETVRYIKGEEINDFSGLSVT